jgi:hypothetical protein
MEGKRMAYAQWITVKINAINSELKIKNATLAWGKFHLCGNKDTEIEVATINAVVIHAGDSYTVCSCGRSDAASGTEGHFDIYDGDTRIGNFYWDCPWGKKSNSFLWASAASQAYVTQCEGGNPYAGAIGNMSIKVVKI